MGGLSIGEIAIIAIVILIVIGPKKLPEVAKSLGKGYSEFRNALNGLKASVDLDLNMTDSGKKKPSSNSTNKTSTSPYKSRWEEQILDIDAEEIDEDNSVEAKAADKEELDTPIITQGRAGRGSLIIDDEEKEG